MAGTAVTTLKGKHSGEDIWIVAAGPSAGFVEQSFFGNKITIGVNRVWVRFRTDYLVVKEAVVLQAAIDSGVVVITSKHSCGMLSYEENRPRIGPRSACEESIRAGDTNTRMDRDWYYFEHVNNEIERVDLSVIGMDKIVVSFSTITSAMHLAAYMGAENIILVGHDCGTIDGKFNFDGYPECVMKSDVFYEDFLTKIEPQSVAVRERLKEVYGCNIYSLNPFLNFGLEGHDYES